MPLREKPEKREPSYEARGDLAAYNLDPDHQVVAGLLITNEAMVADRPKKDSGAPAMLGSDVGGTDYQAHRHPPPAPPVGAWPSAIKAAKFPTVKSLDTFDFAAPAHRLQFQNVARSAKPCDGEFRTQPDALKSSAADPEHGGYVTPIRTSRPYGGWLAFD